MPLELLIERWSATNRCLKAIGHNPIEPLRDALVKVWGEPASPRLVVWPLSLRIGRKSHRLDT
jgi:hypothetical protein